MVDTGFNQFIDRKFSLKNIAYVTDDVPYEGLSFRVRGGVGVSLVPYINSCYMKIEKPDYNCTATGAIAPDYGGSYISVWFRRKD